MADTASTRDLAKAAAMKILREGERPTAEKVRQAVGRGAQQTILSALDEFWLEIGQRLREPRLPAPLLDLVSELWSAALQAAGSQWDGERERHASQVADLSAVADSRRLQRDELAAQLEAARIDRQQIFAELEQRTLTLADTRREADALGEAVRGLQAVEAALRVDLAAEREAREGDQLVWLKQVDELRQHLRASAAALAKTQQALDQTKETVVAQRVELARALQRVEDLDRQVQDRVAEVAVLRGRLERNAAEAQGLRVELAASTHERERVAVAMAEAQTRIAGLQARCDALTGERQAHLSQLAVQREASDLSESLRRDLLEILRPVLEQGRASGAADAAATGPA